jgi:hypothetical protein
MNLRTVTLSLILAFGSCRPSAAGPSGASSVPTGHLRLTFTERCPWATLQETVRRLDIDFRTLAASETELAQQDYDLGRQSFEVFVPPASGSTIPCGLLVWVGVGPARAAWHDVLSRHGLILISAIPDGTRAGFIRMRLPLDAVHNMKRRYALDETRVYVGGFSAGAGVAVHLVCGFPEVFRGGLFLMGGSFCQTWRNESGRYEPTLVRMTPSWKGDLDHLKKDLGLVLMRSSGDPIYSPQEDQAQYESLRLDGFERVSFLVVAAGGHAPPDALGFERSILALESPPKTALVIAPTKDPQPLPSQIAQAERLLATAQLELGQRTPRGAKQPPREEQRKSCERRARSYLQQVVADYPATPAATKARQLLAGIPP